MIAVDWSERRGVVSFDGSEKRYFVDLHELLASLAEPTEIALESTFESFQTARRAEVMRLAREGGHTLKALPPRLTAKTRREMFGEDKTDEIDVEVLWHLAQNPSRTRRPANPDPALVAKREEAGRTLMLLRRSGTRVARAQQLALLEGAGKFTPPRYESSKDEWARRLVAKLPKFASLPEDTRKAIGAGDGYSLVAVAAVGVVALVASGRREADTLMGLHAHAYPSQVRADLHHYCWAGGNTRARLDREGGWVRVDGLTMSAWRRSLRWLYAQLKTIVRDVPLPAGIISPAATAGITDPARAA